MQNDGEGSKGKQGYSIQSHSTEWCLYFLEQDSNGHSFNLNPITGHNSNCIPEILNWKLQPVTVVSKGIVGGYNNQLQTHS